MKPAIPTFAAYAVALFGLAGCAAQLPVDNRSPEQIAASVKDKSISALCYNASSLTVSATISQLSVDSQVIRNGIVTLDCSAGTITMSNDVTPPARAVAASAPGAISSGAK